MKHVAITGLALLVPGYSGPEELFSSLYDGKSLLKKVTIDNQSPSIDLVCSPVNGEQIHKLEKTLPELKGLNASSSAKMALYAAKQAIKKAEIDTKSISYRCGVFVGCNKNLPSIDSLFKLWRSKEGTNKNESDAIDTQVMREDFEKVDQSKAAKLIAEQLNISGKVMTFSDACTAGAVAIISGQRRILSGELDVAICGATENATDSLFQTSFAGLGALNTQLPDDPTTASRPFDKDRSGCILADAAAFLVLEDVEHAKSRNANILAYLVGSNRLSEAHKITATEKSGHYYARTMETAITNANLKPDDIQHISAHGTSTPSNDLAESNAIDKVFGSAQKQLDGIPGPLVTSTKSSLGHSLGASAAIEAVLSVQSLLEQKVLPTLNYCEPKLDERRLNIVTKGQQHKLDYVLSNSFGFGGENACLIFSRNAEKTEALQC